MSKLFSSSLSGAHVPHHKNTTECATVDMAIPDKVRIPMSMHIGRPCEPTVKLMDLVKVGQVIGDSDAFIGAPIHSSVSGKVTAIEDYTMPNGSVCKAVVIETDKLQEVDESVVPPTVTNHEEFVKAVRAAGLVGLGGAGFPTSVKLAPKNLDEMDTLIINGAECEPYITADYRTMMEDSEALIDGIEQVVKYMDLKKAIIGIENNKPKAIQKLTEMTASNPKIEVRSLKAIYPQGGEKVLVYETTRRVVGEGKLPSDVNCLVMNVSTLVGISNYLKTGMPLTTKRLTVDGDAIANPMNVRVPIGASYQSVIDFTGGFKSEPKKVIFGGPMMGGAIGTTEASVLKQNNAILAFTKDLAEEPEENPCIRCARCINACPFELMPAAIDKAYHAGNVELLKTLKVNLCMECGCCSFVCPAKRKLVAYNRLAKRMVADAGKK